MLFSTSILFVVWQNNNVNNVMERMAQVASDIEIQFRHR
jgi:hypothetical protein